MAVVSRFRSAPGATRDRIQAALEERVAAREPLQREPSTGECTVAHHGFARVVGARRHEPARPVEVRRDDELVASNQRERDTRANLSKSSATEGTVAVFHLGFSRTS